MIIKPIVRGFICVTAHPGGCVANVREQIAYVKSRPPLANPPKKALVIGSSTGYGLASRIVAAFGGGAATIGVFYEKPGTGTTTGSAGWYNSVAFEEVAREAGLYAKSVNEDAFSHQTKAQVVDIIKQDIGQVDCVVYSLASPRRADPDTGQIYRSVLKPIGKSFSEKNLNTDKGIVSSVRIEPATGEEIEHTVKVMGGEDWEMWIDHLAGGGVLADGFKTVAYSYIGPDLTRRIYADGTIGMAKKHLEESCARMNGKFGTGSAFVSVNKALVTQASSAIPVVPLYLSLLSKVMKEKGSHEGGIEQVMRLFADHFASESGPTDLDECGRIRMDDWEMQEDVQAAVTDLWGRVNSNNLNEITDFAGYKADFLRLFGFGLSGIDYETDVNLERRMPPFISFL